MVNRRLRGALLNSGLTPARLAELVDVDGKTVRRWLIEDRVPYPVSRHRVAQLVGQEETFLWPALIDGANEDPACGGIAEVWATRSAIPADRWHQLFDQTRFRLDIFVNAGMFLMEAMDLLDVLRAIAARGAEVRIVVGDPDSSAVIARSEEIGAPWLADQCRSMRRCLERLQSPRVMRRQNATVLYASQLRFDDVLIVNPHVFGVPAARSPAELLRKGTGPPFDFYANAFERVWVNALPI